MGKASKYNVENIDRFICSFCFAPEQREEKIKMTLNLVGYESAKFAMATFGSRLLYQIMSSRNYDRKTEVPLA
ncbi:hypothetical protein PQ465_05975 [Sphingobacterium oryzagri]|uniref:Uncharacterized protein n=1 Tax=Sphingobacterium oryzagri TaxID=3025669 RepID=A0ABY7WK03_9SPHI|nr:hypothetical protein [Sphingobacterium sp. KACC 22765]WDF69922.1 hypothetical protein PQ465_05975 [Sphingobacterium sp. KACC 22765]